MVKTSVTRRNMSKRKYTQTKPEVHLLWYVESSSSLLFDRSTETLNQ